ncbi:MAG: DUF4336 domain-containing protein [Elainella sp. Prado103]|jgi:hypothetical protein|nr:DUF4336 domain-containing protein [Elainella sp. Prado103]
MVDRRETVAQGGQAQGKQAQGKQAQGKQAQPARDWSWNFWPVLPLYPYGQRRTLRYEIVKDTIWTFDQIQGILYTVVPIRMTVVKLLRGGLLVYAPVAPTPECLRLLQELIDQHGDVQHIVLPTSSGLEHKIFVGPFARRFRQAQVWIAPSQWSFPLNLPLSWLGFPAKRTQVLPIDSQQTPWADEFDYAILELDLGRGAFSEVAFLHRRSRTLLVTDALIAMPDQPPEIVQLDPYPLLFHARDSAADPIVDTPENRRKGWQRICLFSVYFRPSALEPVQLGQAVKAARQSPDRSRQNYFGLYPFRWQSGWEQSFARLRAGGRPFVAPILQTLIFPQAPQRVLDWADRIAHWPFERVIPCHLDAPIVMQPQQFRQAFRFLEKSARSVGSADAWNLPLPEADFTFIRELETTLVKRGIARPAQGKV